MFKIIQVVQRQKMKIVHKIESFHDEGSVMTKVS